MCTDATRVPEGPLMTLATTPIPGWLGGRTRAVIWPTAKTAVPSQEALRIDIGGMTPD